MKKIILVLLLSSLAWYGYGKYQRHIQSGVTEMQSSQSHESTYSQSDPAPAAYTCDGRIYCSQMSSCQEATYFLRHCPGTKMDGNGDGIPCEKQWCR
jgi:Excalibur calcium-binding domain